MSISNIIIVTSLWHIGGVDYVSGPYNVTFPAGTIEVSFDVILIGDKIFESDERFRLSISNSLPGHVTVGDLSMVNVTIVDNDGKLLLYELCINYLWLIVTDITVRFNQSTYSVNENDGSVQPILVLSNPSSTNISVQVRDNSNTATGE